MGGGSEMAKKCITYFVNASLGGMQGRMLKRNDLVQSMREPLGRTALEECMRGPLGRTT